MEAANILAYYDRATLTAVKCFVVKALLGSKLGCACPLQSFSVNSNIKSTTLEDAPLKYMRPNNRRGSKRFVKHKHQSGSFVLSVSDEEKSFTYFVQVPIHRTFYFVTGSWIN
jgi:hypothetical protein